MLRARHGFAQRKRERDSRTPRLSTVHPMANSSEMRSLIQMTVAWCSIGRIVESGANVTIRTIINANLNDAQLSVNSFLSYNLSHFGGATARRYNNDAINEPSLSAGQSGLCGATACRGPGGAERV